MSTLTLTNIDTGNTTTNLSLRTGNTLGGKVVVNAGGGVDVYGNSSVVMFVANSSGTHFVQNIYTTASFLPTTMTTGNATFSGAWVNVTSNTFNLGTATIGTAVGSSGYTYLPNGMKMQWGVESANNSGTVVTFPSAFSVNCFVIQLTRYGVSFPGADVEYRYWNVNATAFTYYTSNTSSWQASWIAIGV